MSGADLTNPIFILICLMTALLVLFLYEVVRTPPELARPTEQPVLNLPEPPPPASAAPPPPAPPPPLPVRRPQGPVFPVAVGRQPENGRYSARHASVYVPVVSRPKVVGRPPWDPAPKPPDLNGAASLSAGRPASPSFFSYGFAAVNAASVQPLVGASGAIAGVLGAYLVLYPRARVWSLPNDQTARSAIGR